MKSDFAKLFGFTLTLFTSALLLFLVQPMVGKLILPLLGGTPAVWNTCMVFFQALLLAGYSYAHFSTKYFGVKKQSFYHLFLMIVPFFFVFPITIWESLLVDTESYLIPKLLAVLFISAGIPFFVVSSSAPLLQRWFSRTGHPSANDPYFLYAASNLGSMIALVGYPAFVEPHLTLQQQRWGWGIGYAVLVGLTAVCSWMLRVSPDSTDGPAEVPANPEILSWPRIVRWVFLGAVPSSLMLGATTYMTTDIAAIPLLWVAPLAIYLLSFIIVFARVPAWVHFSMVLMMPLGVLLLLFLMLAEIKPGDSLLYLIGVHLAVLFLVAMVCHGELAKDRPNPENLTAFYLWMSLGGVVGGLFNGLVAPSVFPTIAEYQVALVVACMLLPPLADTQDNAWTRLADLLLVITGLIASMVFLTIRSWDRDLSAQTLSATWLFAILVGMAVAWAVYQWAKRGLETSDVFDLALPATFGLLAIALQLGVYSDLIYVNLRTMMEKYNLFPKGMLVLIYGVPCILCYTLVDRPMRFALGLTSIIAATAFTNMFNKDLVWQSRGFFGALKIEKSVEDGYSFIKLLHGTTLHGMQPTNEGLQVVPLTYYHTTGPVGHVMNNYIVSNEEGRFPPVAVIGLGTGTLSVYAHSNQIFDFYDIDPLVKSISFDEKDSKDSKTFFKYTALARERGANVNLILGDARVMLKNPNKGSTEKYGIIAVDAFSSDAIPVHLLTREAMEIYLERLAPHGVVVFHTSNRYLRLEPVLANLAKSLNLAILANSDSSESHIGKSASTWVALARDYSDLSRLMGPETTEKLTKQTRDLVTPLCLLPMPEVALPSLVVAGAVGKIQPAWEIPPADEKVGLWTDDYSNILSVFTSFKISSLLLWLMGGLVLTALCKGPLLSLFITKNEAGTGGESQTIPTLIGDSFTSFLLLVGLSILIAVPAAMLLEWNVVTKYLGPGAGKILVAMVFAALDFLVQLGILGQSLRISADKSRTLAFVGLIIDSIPVGLLLGLNHLHPEYFAGS